MPLVWAARLESSRRLFRGARVCEELVAGEALVMHGHQLDRYCHPDRPFHAPKIALHRPQDREVVVGTDRQKADVRRDEHARRGTAREIDSVVPKLLDFGLSRATATGDRRFRKTITLGIMGDAPEPFPTTLTMWLGGPTRAPSQPIARKRP